MYTHLCTKVTESPFNQRENYGLQLAFRYCRVAPDGLRDPLAAVPKYLFSPYSSNVYHHLLSTV